MSPLPAPGPVPSALIGTSTSTSSPTPTPGELDPNDVSPGLLGFAVVFAIVLLCIPLFRSMTSKIRRVEHGTDEASGPAGGTGEPDSSPDHGPAAGAP